MDAGHKSWSEWGPRAMSTPARAHLPLASCPQACFEHNRSIDVHSSSLIELLCWVFGVGNRPQMKRNEGATTMGQDTTDGTTARGAVDNDGLLVVAQWQAKEGQADRVAEILSRF